MFQIIGILLQDDLIIKWPSFGMDNFIGFVVFIAIMILVYYLGYRYVSARAAKNTRWNIVLSYMLRHDLSAKEIEIVRACYQLLEARTQEDLIMSKKRFHKMINDSIFENMALQAEDRVNIMEKLFSSREHAGEIQAPADIYIGESCAIESGEDKIAGVVIKKWPDQFLISIENFDPVGLSKENGVGLYFFRPHFGSFMVYGTLAEIGPDFIRFKFDGRVEQKSGHHFMAEISSGCTLKPWPLPAANTRFAGHIIDGNTKIFSDRAVIFSALNEEDVPYYLNHHEIWFFQAKLPSGYLFSCRGTILPSKLYEKSCVFKFLDASEVARNVLYAEIQNFNPVKEAIG